MEFYLAIEQNLVIYRKMEPEITMLSELSQTQKDKQELRVFFHV